MKSLLKSFHFFRFPHLEKRTSVSPRGTSDSGLRTPDFGLRTSDSRLRTPDSDEGECRSAFSLIEVNVAILVIAGGMLSLFTLFPAGLRMSTSALSDTRQALFADDFFAYFEAGVLQIPNRDSWQNIETFWKYGCEKGLEKGFKTTFGNGNWSGDQPIRDKWDSKLTANDFTMGSPDKKDKFFLRFRSGKIEQYFSKGSNDAGNLDAEFVVRIASDTSLRDENGKTVKPADSLIWRVSLIVSDEGENGWFYDNPVYHRDFRYAELP